MNTDEVNSSFAAQRVWHTRVNGIRLGGIRAEIKNGGMRDGKLRARVCRHVSVSGEDLDACVCAAGKRDGDGLLSGGGAVGDRGNCDCDTSGESAGAPAVDAAARRASRSARVTLRGAGRDSRGSGSAPG